LSAFFDLIQHDPVVSQVKLIAEPRDLGEGGYQVGNNHNRSWNCGAEGDTGDAEVPALRRRTRGGRTSRARSVTVLIRNPEQP
jgi:pullulanase/glycogen debranching enzyme